MAINQKIFKAYDVRGIYPDEVNEEAAERIGAAFAVWVGDATEVVVGRDARVSSPSLFNALAKGIMSQGKNVVDIGICTTPMLSFGVIKRECKGGIMISASHNPGQYNAFKLIGEKGVQMTDEKYAPIKDMAVKDDFAAGSETGMLSEKNMLEEYVSHVLVQANPAVKNLKIVVDYGNGVGAISAKPAFERLGVAVVSLYDKPDGTFPNHPADPHNIENMRELRERVVVEKADLGIFFDGDADRSIIVDETGEIVFADMLLALLAKEELKKYPGEKIYYDLRFSKVVKELVEENGGVPVMMRVGNPFYKEKLIFEGGALAGELSGHIMFKDNYGIDDGLFAAIKTMNILCENTGKISELINSLKKYFATEEINMKVSDADTVMQKAAERYNDGHSIDLDGVYIEYSDWWFNLRKSNTEPLVRLRVEANTKELLEEKRAELVKLITDN
jgi:phosphomannomutase